jgi:hypothetical protein
MSGKLDLTNNDRYRLAIVAGTAFKIGLEFSDLCGASMADTLELYSGGIAQIRASAIDAVLAEFSVVIDSESSQVVLSLTDEDTAELEAGRYYWDVILTSDTEGPISIVEGTAQVTVPISHEVVTP